MNLKKDIDQYKNSGYLFSSQILQKDEIEYLRKNLEDEFKNINFTKKTLPINELRNSDLVRLILKIFSSPLIKDLITQFENNLNLSASVLPPILIMRNYHVNVKKNHGWHRDCGGELSYDYCKNILAKENYLFSKCGIYLQENSNDIGGSIDIIESSNKYFQNNKIFIRKIKSIPFKVMEKIHQSNKKLYYYLYEKQKKFLPKAKTLYPKPGSAVFFDSRVIHRGTVANKLKSLDFSDDYYTDAFKENETKLSIYSHFGSTEAVDSYMFDRLKRPKNKDEIKTWEMQIKFIEKFDQELSTKMYSVMNSILNKYN